jgi:hypothetical protein
VAALFVWWLRRRRREAEEAEAFEEPVSVPDLRDDSGE